MSNLNNAPAAELLPRERRFLERVTSKYSEEGKKALFKSLLIFTALVTVAHLIERSGLPGWAALIAIYFPATWLFFRYRRMSIFKSRLMRKLFILEQMSNKKSPPGEPVASQAAGS